MRGWSILFAVAALFNLAIGLAMMFAPAAMAGLPEAPAAALLPYRAMGWFIFVFGIGYAIVASHPLRHSGIVQIGVFGKLGFVVLMAVAWQSGLMTTTQFAPCLADLPWAAAFIVFLARTRNPR